jgi:hypothetical protein
VSGDFAQFVDDLREGTIGGGVSFHGDAQYRGL